MYRALLLVLVALAGCGSFAGGDAPGVTVEGAVDADRLLAADARVRDATSYRVVRNVTVRGDGWTTRADRVRDANGTAAYQRLDITESARLGAVVGRGEVWTNGSAVYVRTYAPDGTRIERGRLPSEPRHYALLTELRGRLLRAGEFRAEPTDGGAVLRSAGDLTLSGNPVAFSVGDPRNVTARVTVAESGLVESVRVAYDAPFRGEFVRVEIRHRVVAVGETTVERPAWTTED
ncbi:hypothetical protein [Halosegnis marinus]|uniref:Lipoprotein n=1 Tax=Halosegnis marinus TaxID=3034023 RepID=A0ABD5ZP31_9EURY|nr:hypothetical protein [Halosegnis sp. DT85]